MDFKPYPHQKAGIDWIISKKRCALFWGMGTGKTVTTLTAIDHLLNDELEYGPVLVIAPLRVAENTWTNECAKWEHLRHLSVVPMTGSKERRIESLRSAQSLVGDIYVINRENVQWLCETCGNDWPFRIVVIDELSSFKSAQSKRWRCLKKYIGRMDRVIGLTGTPRPNGLEDLWPQLYLLDKGQRLGRTLSEFRSNYLRPARSNGYIVYKYEPLPGAEERAYESISDICMSLRKADVLNLPGQIYEDVVVRMSNVLINQYKSFEREMVLDALGPDNEIAATSAASLTNKLLQFANGAIYDNDRQWHALHEAKLDALDELLEQAGGEPVLVLYAYKHDAERIRERVDCRALDTPRDIEDWNAGRIRVALAHPASIGHGLNLQDGGHIIIWFGLTWSLELYQQANERLNRPGQKNVCRIYHIITEGTHDARVLRALSNKDKGQNAAIEALRLEVLNGRTS